MKKNNNHQGLLTTISLCKSCFKCTVQVVAMVVMVLWIGFLPKPPSSTSSPSFFFFVEGMQQEEDSSSSSREDSTMMMIQSGDDDAFWNDNFNMSQKTNSNSRKNTTTNSSSTSRFGQRDDEFPRTTTTQQQEEKKKFKLNRQYTYLNYNHDNYIQDDFVMDSNNNDTIMNVTILDCEMRLLAIQYGLTTFTTTTTTTTTTRENTDDDRRHKSQKQKRQNHLLTLMDDALQMTKLCPNDYYHERVMDLRIEMTKKSTTKRTNKLRSETKTTNDTEQQQEKEQHHVSLDDSSCQTFHCIYIHPTEVVLPTNHQNQNQNNNILDTSPIMMKRTLKYESKEQIVSSQLQYHVTTFSLALEISRTKIQDPYRTTIIFRKETNHNNKNNNNNNRKKKYQKDDGSSSSHTKQQMTIHSIYQNHHNDDVRKNVPVITLNEYDSGLTLMGQTGKELLSYDDNNEKNQDLEDTETVDDYDDDDDDDEYDIPWLAGSIAIPSNTSWEWDCNVNINVRVANLTTLLQSVPLPILPSLFATSTSVNDHDDSDNESSTIGERLGGSGGTGNHNDGRRYVRSRVPNMNPEYNQWGYNSPNHLNYSFPPTDVIEWHLLKQQQPPPQQQKSENKNNNNTSSHSFGPPNFIYHNFMSYDPNHPNLWKNDSCMLNYNIYGTGYGGSCAAIWGNNDQDENNNNDDNNNHNNNNNKDYEERYGYESYWCSNISDGGWGEVDREAAITGNVQIPIGMTINGSSSMLGHYLSRYVPRLLLETSYDPPSSNGTTTTILEIPITLLNGGIIHAWHSQTWAMHMFEIMSSTIVLETTSDNGSSHDDKYTSTMKENQNQAANAIPTIKTIHLQFKPGSGNQGGRNWCRCDQCTYAGYPWCGQYKNPPDPTDQRLISGTWLLENVILTLDQPGEYYFNPNTKLLYVYPNVTTTTSSDSDTSSDSNDSRCHKEQGREPNGRVDEDSQDNTDGLRNLRFSVSDTILKIVNATDITIQNLGFRETSSTYMNPDWYPPSGGDWSLHRGGALFIENSTNITIKDCTFAKLDGNAIFLSKFTRNVTIQSNEFEYIGENAIVLWGETNEYDATTNVNQPRYTLIEYNLMRELGLYQKQSSGISHNKARDTIIRNNIIFNVPRAAINLNDMMGGGDVIMNNLLFNTCRESGDHGPINTWDRQPFLTSTCSNCTGTFIPSYRTIASNFIFANYGASQGVDNDDGSSWYHVHHNVFYYSIGMKMDYGGHDSIFEDNVIIIYPPTKPQPQLCVDFQQFKKNHGHIYRRNVCIASNTKNYNRYLFQYHHDEQQMMMMIKNRTTIAENSWLGSSNDEEDFNSSQILINNPERKKESETFHSHSNMNRETGPVIRLELCNESNAILYENEYYTPDGQLFLVCGYEPNSPFISLSDMQILYGLEINTTVSKSPTIRTVLDMVLRTLYE